MSYFFKSVLIVVKGMVNIVLSIYFFHAAYEFLSLLSYLLPQLGNKIKPFTVFSGFIYLTISEDRDDVLMEPSVRSLRSCSLVIAVRQKEKLVRIH